MSHRCCLLVISQLRRNFNTSAKSAFSRSDFRWRPLCRNLVTSSSAKNGSTVRIVEVGPRDGLQNISQPVATPVKVELIHRLVEAGVRNIEATSFVSPKWVPQMADGAEVISQVLHLGEQGKVRFPVLAPNMKGLQNAIQSGVKEVVVFASATEAFSQKNQNCTVKEALSQATIVAEKAREHEIAVRGVVSCIFADPYSGPTPPSSVLYIVKRLLEIGCYEVGLGDTLGVGTPTDTQNLLEILLRELPADKLAGHFHDTYGQAVANVVKAFDMGLRTFDSSVAGLGGCPYAKGAKGNLATEDIVYTFEKSGIHTGIDLERLASVGQWISQKLNLPNGSRAGSTLHAKRESEAEPPSRVGKPSERSWKKIQDNGEYAISRAGTALKITLTRPQNGNALTGSMVEGLTSLFTNLQHDTSVFHVVLTAEGRFFCTGMDLSGGTETSGVSNPSSYYSQVVNLFSAIDSLPQTTIGMIDGLCFGGGVGLGFTCDIRLVSSKVRWTLTEIKLGLSPAVISKYLIREWGIPFLREAMLTGREVAPAELHRIGAVHGIAEDTESLSRMTEEYLDKLTLCAPRSAAACKDLVNVAWRHPGGQIQDERIRTTFERMMAPGSEGSFGIEQFQKKVRQIDWAHFWVGGGAKL